MPLPLVCELARAPPAAWRARLRSALRLRNDGLAPLELVLGLGLGLGLGIG